MVEMIINAIAIFIKVYHHLWTTPLIFHELYHTALEKIKEAYQRFILVVEGGIGIPPYRVSLYH